MILILSEESDFSTGQIILWLEYFKKDFIRINENDEVILKELTHNNMIFGFQEKTIKMSDIDSIWYRRGNFNINTQPFKIKNEDKLLNNYNGEEGIELCTHIHNIFQTKKCLNNYNYSTVNKLDVLYYCAKERLNTANYIVTQSKKALLNFYQQNKGNIISKAMNNPFLVVSKNSSFSTYTHKVNLKDIQKLPKIFTPTFFQKELKKKYEIRTFYLDSKFYNMAIFSQSNSQTEIDFRHYDWKKPNRVTPVKLPLSFEKKLKRMLTHFKINCASLDTIVTPDNEYYMIDINAIGQFGMTSRPCNFGLEKKIAEYLA